MRHQNNSLFEPRHAATGGSGVATFSAPSAVRQPFRKDGRAIAVNERIQAALDFDAKAVSSPRTGIYVSCDYSDCGRGAAFELPIKGGKVALVHPRDGEILQHFLWSSGPHGYPVSTLGGGFRGRQWLMHRLLTGLHPTLETDHIDQNIFDSRRCNLRFVTRTEQLMNRRGWGRSGFKGVMLPHGTTKGYAAIIQGDRIGTFPTAVEAAKAYDREAFSRFGLIPRFNFPENFPKPMTNVPWPHTGSLVERAIEWILRKYRRAVA